MRDAGLTILAKYMCPSLALMISPFSLARDCMVVIAANIIINMGAELMGKSWSQRIRIEHGLIHIFIIVLSKKYTKRLLLFPISSWPLLPSTWEHCTAQCLHIEICIMSLSGQWMVRSDICHFQDKEGR